MQSQRKVVDAQVNRFLQRSQGFRALSPAERAEIQRNTANIVGTMVDNELARARRAPTADPYAVPLLESGPTFPTAPTAPGVTPTAPTAPTTQFTGGVQPGAGTSGFGPKKQGDFGSAIATGVNQAGALLRQVNFPAFVAELVQGVFQAVVDASMQQMRAYADLVRSVSMSLSDFRDQNVTQNQARDHLVSKFPSMMQLNFSTDGPTVGLRDDVDEDELASIGEELGLDEDLSDLDDETIEQKLVPAARNELARSRQSLLATTLLMGLNRIVVTDGKINAKMKFSFRARDSHTTRSQARDYDEFGIAKASQSFIEESSGAAGTATPTTAGGPAVVASKDGPDEGGSGDGSRWSSGADQYQEMPVVYLTQASDTASAGELEAQARLSGDVSLNFRSETFDVNQIATAGEVFALQQAQGAGRGAPAATASPTTSATPGQAPPQTGPAGG